MEALPAFLTRLKGIAQDDIDLEEIGNDFVNISPNERDKGCGLFSLSHGAPPTADIVKKRAKKQLRHDRFLHSGERDEVFYMPSYR
jgi:hypothetical protein